MRLTVGPLPSAVYWRRRAIVLGALLMIVIALYASCSGSGSENGAEKDGGAGSTATPSTDPTPTGPEPTDSIVGTQSPESPGTDDGTGTGITGAGGDLGPTVPAPAPQVPGGGSGPCADDEVSITPIPAKTVVNRQASFDIRLVIENSSGRACSRDVGADAQELRIVQGAETIWSSDRCGTTRGSEVRTMPAGEKLEYMVTWNGRSSAECEAGVPTGAVPPAGTYQVLARLGSKVSSPVALTLR